MSPEILIVRNGDKYDVLHGHLRLVNVFNTSDEAIVDASGEGKVKIMKSPGGIFVVGKKLPPLLLNLPFHCERREPFSQIVSRPKTL